MDAFDVKLLAALQEDGRLTNNEIADKVGLSAAQCSRRRTALEDASVIRSYHATLSRDALGLDVLVFVHVTLARHSPDNARNFHSLVEKIEEVQEAYSLTGEADYLLKVTVQDLKALARILNDVLLRHESVAHVRTSVVLERLKQSTSLPLSHLLKSSATPTHGAKLTRRA